MLSIIVLRKKIGIGRSHFQKNRKSAKKIAIGASLLNVLKSEGFMSGAYKVCNEFQMACSLFPVSVFLKQVSSHHKHCIIAASSIIFIKISWPQYITLKSWNIPSLTVKCVLMMDNKCSLGEQKKSSSYIKELFFRELN